MKKYKGKYDQIFEDTIYRYQSGGLTTGDVVTIKKDALKHPKVSSMPQTYQEQIKNAIETDLNLRVAAVKSIRPSTSGFVGGAGSDAVSDFFVDIVVEYAPGLWREPMTLPIDILERVDTGINMAPIPDSLKKKTPSTKPSEISGNDSDRMNPTSNTVLPTASISDGRDQVQKPIEEELTLEEVFTRMIEAPKTNIQEAVQSYTIEFNQPWGGMKPETLRNKIKELLGSNQDLEPIDEYKMNLILVNDDLKPLTAEDIQKQIASVISGTVDVNLFEFTAMTYDQFAYKFNTDKEFHSKVASMIEEIGGLNLWDTQDIDAFYEIWKDQNYDLSRKD